MKKEKNNLETPYEERFIPYADLNLFQIVRQQTSETLLVFFHGIGDSHLNYLDFFYHPALKDYSLVICDLPGHGRSSKALSYSFDLQTKALAAALQSLIEAHQTVLFIPHSMGGIHATLLARTAFLGKVSGIFALETSVTQYGSFIARKLHQALQQKEDLVSWFRLFSNDILSRAAAGEEFLKRYYAALQFVRLEAFIANAEEMYQLAHALKGERFTSLSGRFFADLAIPKIYAISSSFLQKPTISFLEKERIPMIRMHTSSHWVAQNCMDAFCRELKGFLKNLQTAS